MLKIDYKFLLGLIILLSIFFRFYRLLDLQYWSVDEEGVYFSARRVFVLAKPILLAPSATTIVSMGPLFTYLSALLFFITGSNLVLVLAFGSFLGVFITWLIYHAAKTFFNRKIGLIAAFFYASSFLIAFFDRRWWQLSLDSLLTIIALISIVKIYKKKYYFSLPLAISISFAWNADPSLLAIFVATVFSFIYLKLPLYKPQYKLALGWLFLSLLPFLISEVRHPGSISRPSDEYLSRIFQSTGRDLSQIGITKIFQIAENFNRILFTPPSLHIDDHFYCLPNYSPSWFSPYSTIIVLIILTMSLLNKKHLKNLKVLIIFLGSFVCGILSFNALTKVEMIQSYFLVIWPVFLLIMAVGLEWLMIKRRKLFVYSFLTIILLLNLYTLIKAELTYPLKTKLKVVRTTVNNLTSADFALYPLGVNYGFEGGGWDSLFTIKGRPASWSPFTHMTRWIFQAYSLYPTEPKKEESLKQKVILLAPDVKSVPEDDYNKYLQVENIRILIKN